MALRGVKEVLKNWFCIGEPVHLGLMKSLLSEASIRPFKGSVLTLGRQDLRFSYDELKFAAKEFNVQLRESVEIVPSEFPSSAKLGGISNQTFYGALGFTDCQALDATDYEGADIIADLNVPIPEQFHNQFDVIVDWGTLEHVFHLPQALDNLFKMLRIGGRIIHFDAASNSVDHGFYMYSPTLFWDFYECNGFNIDTLQLVKYASVKGLEYWEFYDYVPGFLDGYAGGGLEDTQYCLFCVVTKKKESTGNAIPQQRHYAYRWRYCQFDEWHGDAKLDPYFLERPGFATTKKNMVITQSLNQNP